MSIKAKGSGTLVLLFVIKSFKLIILHDLICSYVRSFLLEWYQSKDVFLN